MSAMNIATSKCNQIHNLVQSSGLHFAIHQTPFSSYITIRKKLIPQEALCRDSESIEVDKVESDAVQVEELRKSFNNVRVQYSQLSKVHEKVKAAFEDEVGEHEATFKENRELLWAKSNQFKKILNMEEENDKIKAEIRDLTRQLTAKDGIIQSMNKGFTEKIKKMQEKIDFMEQAKLKKELEEKANKKTEKKIAKKEKKIAKKIDENTHNNESLDTMIVDVDNLFKTVATEEESEFQNNNNITDNIVDKIEDPFNYDTNNLKSESNLTILSSETDTPSTLTTASSTSFKGPETAKFNRSLPYEVKCEFCDKTFPWSNTLDVAIHTHEHKKAKHSRL